MPRATSDAARRQAEQQQAGAEHDQPQRHQRHGERGEPAQELPEQQRVAIDRLRQHAAQRAAIEFAVDRSRSPGRSPSAG